MTLSKFDTTGSVASAGNEEEEEAAQFLLPPEAYYDQEWYAREQQEIFGRNYSLVGYDSDIPNTGDFLVRQIGFEPAMVVRAPDGGLRAFSNICRHRGMVVALGDGHTDKNLRCIYHGWEYGIDGHLDRIPQRRAQFPTVNLEDYPLLPLAVGSWAGMIFINPDPEAGTLADWLGDYVAPEHAGAFPWSELEEAHRVKVPLKCNWKLYIENHIDCYHLWYLHEESLGMYDHHALTCWKSGLHWGCAEPLREGTVRERPGLVPIPGLSAEEAAQNRANLIFPNVPMTTLDRSVMTYQVVPTGPETCYLDVRVRGAKGYKLDDEVAMLRVLRDEDGLACEQMQAAIRSTRFSVGPLAEGHEVPIMQFHRDVLSFLE